MEIGWEWIGKLCVRPCISTSFVILKYKGIARWATSRGLSYAWLALWSSLIILQYNRSVEPVTRVVNWRGGYSCRWIEDMDLTGFLIWMWIAKKTNNYWTKVLILNAIVTIVLHNNQPVEMGMKMIGELSICPCLFQTRSWFEVYRHHEVGDKTNESSWIIGPLDSQLFQIDLGPLSPIIVNLHGRSRQDKWLRYCLQQPCAGGTSKINPFCLSFVMLRRCIIRIPLCTVLLQPTQGFLTG